MPSTHDPYSGIRNPLVRAFALGRASAVLGNQVISTAVGWDLYERTHQAWALGLVGAIELVPVVLLMFVAGNAADRYPRRNVIMAAHGLLTLVGLGLLVASRMGASVNVVYACLFFVGVARAFSAPAGGTILPQLVGAEQLANANAWLSSSYEVAAISGPAVAGFLIAITGSAGGIGAANSSPLPHAESARPPDCCPGAGPAPL